MYNDFATKLANLFTYLEAQNPNWTNYLTLDVILWGQGEADSLGTSSDNYTGGTPNGSNNAFGNNALNFTTTTLFTSTLSNIIVNAGGFNTQIGYTAAHQALMSWLRVLPGAAGSNVPIICFELHEAYNAGEYYRNDYFKTVAAGKYPYMTAVPTAGYTMSTIPGNTEHWDGPSLIAIGTAMYNAYVKLANSGYSSDGLKNLYGDSSASAYLLKVSNNVDQYGINNSVPGTGNQYYEVAADQMRNGLAIYSANSTLVFPNGSYLIGEVSLKIDVWTGSTNFCCLQQIRGLPILPTQVSLPANSHGINFSKALPVGDTVTVGLALNGVSVGSTSTVVTVDSPTALTVLAGQL